MRIFLGRKHVKLSKTAIKELTARYRSVLQKCIVLNMAAFTLLATAPARADSIQQIDGGTQVGQEYYSATAPFDKSYISGGTLTGNSFFTLDRIDVANTYGSDGYTNNIFETINDNSQINLNSGTFAGTIAKAKGYGSDVTLANGTYTGKLKLFAEDNLTVSGGTFGENTLSILDLRAHDITVTNALLNAGVSNYAVVAATKTLTGVDALNLHNAIFTAPTITVTNLTASDNTHIGYQNVLEKYTYTPAEGNPTSWYSAAHATLLQDITVADSTIVLNDTSKIGTGFVGVNIPVDDHDVEATSGAAFFNAGELTAAETASVEHIQNALSNAATNVPAPSMRYGSLPSDVREALDIDYLVGGTTPLSDYVRAQLQAGGDINALNGVVATALNAQFSAYATPSELQARIVAKIQAKLTAVVQDDTILAGDKYTALRTALANVIDTLSPESAAALDEEVSPGVTLRQYIQTELADADNYVNDGAVADLIADLNGRISTALTADEVLAALNNVDVTIHNSAVTMNDTSAIENNYGEVNVSGTSAINVLGGTGLEPATFITAKEDVVFADASTLTVGKAALEENENGSKLNITSATGDILFEGAGSATVNAGSALSLSAANGGITYAKDGNFIIGSAAEDARRATLTITSAAGIATNYRTDYRDFWYDGGTDHHAQINTDDTPGKAHAGLYIDDANPAVAALGATYGENTFVFEDAQLTANNAEITGNLAFHADEHIATDNINNSFVSGNVTVANESGGAFMLNAATSTIGGAVNAYTGRYVFINDAVDPADDTLAYMGGATTLNLGQVGKTVTTTGWAHPTDDTKFSTTNVTIKTSTGQGGDQFVDGSITMTGGLNNLTVGNTVDTAVVNGDVAMTGKEANLIVSANATVTGNVTVSDATPATLTLNGTIGGDATFTGDVKLAASTASSGTVTGALALADDKTFDMQNGSYSTAYAGRYDHLTVGKINAGAAANPTVLKLDVDTGSVSNTKNIDHFTLTNSGSTGKMVISSLRNEKYDSVNDLYTFDELWGLREFSMDVVGLGEGASSEGLTVTLDDALTAERSAAVSGGSLTNVEIEADNASWHRVLTETLAHATNFSTDIDWTLDHFSTYDKVTTKTTNLTLSEGCGSENAGACTLTFTKTAEEIINPGDVIGNTMVALNQQVGGVRSMHDVEDNDGHRFTVTEHLNTTGAGKFTITGMIYDEHPETVVSVIDMNSMNGFTVGAGATLVLDHVSFDNIQGAAGAGTDGKALTIAPNGRAELNTVILAGDDLSAEKKSLIINNGTLAAENSKIMLDNEAGSEAFIYGETTLFSTTNAETAKLKFFGADAVANEITNNGAMFLADDNTDPENIVGAELTTDLTGTGNVTVQEHSILTLAETDGDKENQNIISGAGLTVIDNDALTTTAAIASNITVNAEKSLTGVANLIGAAERTVTNDGTLTITAGVTPGTTDQLAAKIINNGTLSMTAITALADVENNTETFTVSGNVILNAKLTGAVPGANPTDPTTPAKATLSDGAVLTLAGTQNTNTITASAVDAATLKVTNDGTDAHALQNAGKLLVNTTITATEEENPVRSKMKSDADKLGQEGTKIAVTNNGSLVLNGGANANDVKTAYADITTAAGATVSTANHIRLEGDTLGAGSIANTGVLTLAGANNENTIAGAGSIIIDSDNLTTTGALNQAVKVNANKQLTAAAGLIGADVTNNGTLVLKEGTLAHNITFDENADLSIVDGDANAETGVTSNVNLAKATIQNNALLIINADKVRGAFVNNLGGTVNLTGGTLTKALGGKVTLSGATTFGTGADFTGATIKMTEAGSLNIGTNKVTANSVDGGTIFMTLTENAVEDTLVNIAGVVNHDVALSVDNSQVSRFDVQHYYLTATDTGYNLTLTGAGRYAIDTQPFTLEDALTMEAFDPATWHGGDLYMLKLATVAEVAAEKQTESGIVVSQNEQIAVQALSDESRAALTAGQQAQFDQINTRLANAVDAGNREEIRQILREVGAEKAPAVAQTEIANVGAVMNVVGTRLGGGAPAPAAAASGDHGRSGGDEIIAGKASVWGQYMLNTAKLTGQNGFDSDSNGFAFGFEYKINDEYKAGIGYARSSTDITTNRSKTDVDTHTGFLYGEYKPGNFYVNGVLSYGKSSYDEKTKLTGITADYDANTLGVQALTGYSFGNWTPEGGLRYTNVRQKAYTNSLGVRFANKTNDTLTGIVGLRYAKTFKAGSGLLITPEGKLALTYDLSRSNQGRSVTLANGTGYVAEGKNLDRTGLELGAGVSFKVNDSFDIGLSYEGKFRKDYSDHTGLFNVKYNF